MREYLNNRVEYWAYRDAVNPYGSALRDGCRKFGADYQELRRLMGW